MSEPLAILHYSNLMPGGQLANRLQDLGYRVQMLADMAALTRDLSTRKTAGGRGRNCAGRPRLRLRRPTEARPRHAAYSGAGLVGGARSGAAAPGHGRPASPCWRATPPLPNICRDYWTRFCKWNEAWRIFRSSNWTAEFMRCISFTAWTGNAGRSRRAMPRPAWRPSAPPIAQPSHPRLTTYATIGGKADMAFFLLAAELAQLGQMHRDLEACFPPGALLACLFLPERDGVERIHADRGGQSPHADRTGKAGPRERSVQQAHGRVAGANETGTSITAFTRRCPIGKSWAFIR